MVPPQITIMPNYILMASLGGTTPTRGSSCRAGHAFGTFLFRQHFMTLPVSILEAAQIDGAGHWRRLGARHPQSPPTIATVALVSWSASGTTTCGPSSSPTTRDHDPAGRPDPAAELRRQRLGWGVLMAGTVLVIVPILVVFLALQRYLVAGLTPGGVTG